MQEWNTRSALIKADKTTHWGRLSNTINSPANPVFLGEFGSHLLLFLGILFQPLPVSFGLLHHLLMCDT